MEGILELDDKVGESKEESETSEVFDSEIVEVERSAATCDKDSWVGDESGVARA